MPSARVFNTNPKQFGQSAWAWRVFKDHFATAKDRCIIVDLYKCNYVVSHFFIKDRGHRIHGLTCSTMAVVTWREHCITRYLRASEQSIFYCPGLVWCYRNESYEGKGPYLKAFTIRSFLWWGFLTLSNFENRNCQKLELLYFSQLGQR